MTAAAKYPSAALADFAGEVPSQPANELILNADIIATSLAIVATTNIPASWPQPGKMVIDGEVIKYTSYAAATFTIAGVGDRGLETTYGAGVAAAHTAGAVIGNYLTALSVAQIIAEILAHQVALTATGNPNLVMNSDYGRRTVFGLAMPEVFADTNGETAITGVLGTVAANVLTAGGTGAWRASVGPTDVTFWRDGRMSTTFKLVENSTNLVGISKYTDANNFVQAHVIGNATNVLQLQKTIAGAATNVNVATGALTLNRWYWIELSAQGTTYTATLWDTGGTVPGVAKAASTFVCTITTTIADAAVVAGKMTLVSSLGVASQWGGIAATPGGAYMETWLPESWTITHTGTLGGQAIAYDEVADSGPLNRQAVPVVYIPATSRTMTVQYSSPDGAMIASTAYAYSYYLKNTGLGGSGVMIRGNVLEQNSASATQATNSLDDAAEVAYTRKTGTFTTNAATRRFAFQFLINQGGARTGTVRLMLPQVEIGSAATTWKSAAADDGSATFTTQITSGDKTLTSAVLTEVDSRDGAMNVFVPWDCTLRIDFDGTWWNSGANVNLAAFTVDGANSNTSGLQRFTSAAGTPETGVHMTSTVTVSAGKHRIAAVWAAVAGTATLRGTLAAVPARLTVTAMRGK